jgi:hypothetical protein
MNTVNLGLIAGNRIVMTGASSPAPDKVQMVSILLTVDVLY